MPGQEVPFDLVPGTVFDIVFETLSGDEIAVEKVIRDRRSVSYAGSYVPLELKDGNPEGAPTLVANYTPPDVTGGSFTFVTSVGTCDERGNLVGRDAEDRPRLQVDVDGRGFVTVNDTNAFFSYFSPGDEIGQSHPNTPIRLPADTEQIRIALSDATGIVAGPWTYRFDLGEVVRETAVSGPPQVACSGDRTAPRAAKYAMQRQLICVPVSRQSFFDVERVEFGGVAGEFTESVDIDFDAETYMTAACDFFRGECPPFVFDVPGDWLNVYSRIVLEDGTALTPTRHTFQK